jgi:hypothetical protein
LISQSRGLGDVYKRQKEARERILDGTFVAWKNALTPKLGQRL